MNVAEWGVEMPPWHTVRDAMIVSAALLLASWETVYGDGRASVYAFLTGLLLSPAIMQVDVKIKRRRAEKEADDL